MMLATFFQAVETLLFIVIVCDIWIECGKDKHNLIK